jgi:hypothetical protein
VTDVTDTHASSRPLTPTPARSNIITCHCAGARSSSSHLADRQVAVRRWPSGEEQPSALSARSVAGRRASESASARPLSALPRFHRHQSRRAYTDPTITSMNPAMPLLPPATPHPALATTAATLRGVRRGAAQELRKSLTSTAPDTLGCPIGNSQLDKTPGPPKLRCSRRLARLCDRAVLGGPLGPLMSALRLLPGTGIRRHRAPANAGTTGRRPPPTTLAMVHSTFCPISFRLAPPAPHQLYPELPPHGFDAPNA